MMDNHRNSSTSIEQIRAELEAASVTGSRQPVWDYVAALLEVAEAAQGVVNEWATPCDFAAWSAANDRLAAVLRKLPQGEPE